RSGAMAWPARSGRGCAVRVGSGRGGLGGLVQVGDLVAQLRALPDPVVDPLDVHLDALLGAGGHRVVEAHALDVAAVAGAAAVGDDDVVEGALLGAATGEADLDHGVFGVAQLPGWQGKRIIINRFPASAEAAPAHHPLHAAHHALHPAAAHLRHHLFHLLILLHQLVDVGGGHAGTGGDALAPGAVEQRRVAAFLAGHRIDDRDHPRHFLAGDLCLDVVGDLADAGQLVHQAGDAAHVLHLLELVAHVLEVELPAL